MILIKYVLLISSFVLTGHALMAEDTNSIFTNITKREVDLNICKAIEYNYFIPQRPTKHSVIYNMKKGISESFVINVYSPIIENFRKTCGPAPYITYQIIQRSEVRRDWGLDLTDLNLQGHTIDSPTRNHFQFAVGAKIIGDTAHIKKDETNSGEGALAEPLHIWIHVRKCEEFGIELPVYIKLCWEDENENCAIS